MKLSLLLRVLIGATAVAFLSSCEQDPVLTDPIVFTAEEKKAIFKHSPLPTRPENPTNQWADDPAAAKFGQRLFFDKRLSANGAVSCATCHDPAHGFSDGKALSEGLQKTDRHSPSLWNVAWQRWFFWDGRADSLWAQSVQPLLSPAEMGSSPQHLRNVIESDAILNREYEAIFGLQTKESPERFVSNLGKTFEAYQRNIISRDSRFDAFVADLKEGRDDSEVISQSEKRGLRIFVEKECALCHSGPNFSDGEFHNLGLPKVEAHKRDSGRYEGIRRLLSDPYNGIGEHSDDRSEKANIKLRYLVVKLNNYSEFKTPTLRHVALTAPYMHNGSMADFQEVLDFYNELPGEAVLGHREETLVPLNLSEEEKLDLEAFLHTLTGMKLEERLLVVLPQ